MFIYMDLPSIIALFDMTISTQLENAKSKTNSNSTFSAGVGGLLVLSTRAFISFDIS